MHSCIYIYAQVDNEEKQCESQHIIKTNLFVNISAIGTSSGENSCLIVIT